MQVNDKPYWWEDAPRPVATTAPLPTTIDVAIIGGGFSGLCTALVLARSGVSVAVFESQALGYGASTRNGGMVGPSFHKLGIDGLKRKFGEERTNAILRESLNFVDYLENFLNTENIDAGFKRTGRFRGALKPADYDHMARDLDILQEATGLEGYMVPKSEQETETGSPLFHGGLVYTRDGGLHPAKYHDGLVRQARAAGVQIFAQTPVTNLTNNGGDYTVSTPCGDVTAQKVAVCTNGYTGSVTPAIRRRLLPIRSALIATEPLAEEVMRSVMPQSRMYVDSRRVLAYYRPSPDGTRILFGGRAADVNGNPDKNARALLGAMTQIYPQLSNVKHTHSWSGLVAYTFDHTPHLGRFGEGKEDGMYYALGYCGSGVARSTYFGTKLGYKILGSSEGDTAFDDLDFDTRPLYNGNPWFMPAILTWHRMMDRLGL